MRTDIGRTDRRERVWLASLVAGVLGAALSWVTLPHGREVGSLWAYVLLLLAFVAFAGYLFPRISWFYYGGAAAQAQPDLFYTHLYKLMYPALILTVTAAYRLGGGSPGRCLKIAWTGVLILFSGFLDVMWQVVNPVPIPDRIDAPHIALLLGGPVSFPTAVVFTLAHLPVVVGLNLLPLDRWIDRLLGPDTEPAPVPAAAAP